MKQTSESRYVSYSANFEDVILQRLFGGRGNGFYIDVGAAHPTFENDTKLLYEHGWRGINVEPNPSFFELLQAERPRDRNFCLALGDELRTALFYVVVGTGLSTCDPDLAGRARDNGHRVVERRVPMRTLASVLEEVTPSSIDLLKVDVEGFEAQVLAGNDWRRYRPSVVLVEATYPESPRRRISTVRADLEQQGYRWQYFDGLNDYYVRQDFTVASGVFDSPPNIFDRFRLREVVDLEARLSWATRAYEAARDYALSLEHEVRKSRDAQDPRAAAAATLTSTAHSSRSIVAEPEADLGVVLRLQEESERLRRRLEDETFEREHLAQAVTRMRREMLEYNRVFDESRQTVEELDLARRELERAGETLAHVRRQLGSEQVRTARVQAELNAARAGLVATTARLARTQKELAETARAGVTLEDRLAQVTGQYLAVLQSRSWRLTAPMRAVMNVVRASLRRPTTDESARIRAEASAHAD